MGFLDNVVQYLPWCLAPLISGPDDRKTDRPAKSADKFIPSCAVIRLRAGTDQLLFGHGRMACQPYSTSGGPNCISTGRKLMAFRGREELGDAQCRQPLLQDLKKDV